MVAPLFSHGFSNTRICERPEFPPVRTRGHHVDLWFPATNDVYGYEGGKVLEPQAGSLCFPMTKLPRLDDLGRLAYLRTNDRHRVLKGNTLDGGIKKEAYKGQSFLLLLEFCFEPPGP
jgi:hypothetical protein